MKQKCILLAAFVAITALPVAGNSVGVLASAGSCNVSGILCTSRVGYSGLVSGGTNDTYCWRPRSLVMVRRRFVGSVWHWLVVMSVSGEFGGGFLGGGVVDEVFAGGGGGDERGGGGVVELAG